ncbi:MAG TPA: arylsulfatase, partial [Acidimicrobiales bacterium]|nr:arylsulfatase [Acidimicrobiales bacterium]
LAAEYPDRLRDLIDAWWVEAGQHGVLPLDDRTIELFAAPPLPATVHARRDYTYYPPLAHIPADASPPLGSRSWTITADVDVPAGGVEGVLYARGGHNVGHTFFVKDGALQFDYNALGTHHRASVPVSLSPGAHELTARFDRVEKGGTLTLAVDGEDLTAIEIPQIVRMLGSTGLDVGRDALSPVVDDYDAPFAFTGVIDRITFRIRSRADAAEVAATARAELAKE